MAVDVDVYYKCCKNKELKTVICISCGAAYHRGCKERSWSEAEELRKGLIRCCDGDDIEKVNITSNNTFKELLQAKKSELAARNYVIAVKDQLISELYERIRLLEEKINTHGYLTYAGKLKGHRDQQIPKKAIHSTSIAQPISSVAVATNQLPKEAPTSERAPTRTNLEKNGNNINSNYGQCDTHGPRENPNNDFFSVAPEG